MLEVAFWTENHNIVMFYQEEKLNDELYNFGVDECGKKLLICDTVRVIDSIQLIK